MRKKKNVGFWYMARVVKKKKLKCFTRPKKDGGKYTTCMNSKTGRQMRKGGTGSPKKKLRKAKKATAPPARVHNTRSQVKKLRMAPEIVRG